MPLTGTPRLSRTATAGVGSIALLTTAVSFVGVKATRCKPERTSGWAAGSTGFSFAHALLNNAAIADNAARVMIERAFILPPSHRAFGLRFWVTTLIS